MTSVDGRGGGQVEQACRGVVERLRARRGEIVEAIFARVSDQWFERAGSGHPEYLAGLRDATGAALDYGLAGMERPAGFLELVPGEVIEQARRAARAGVGLETVLRQYLAGHAVVQAFVVQEAERDRLLTRGSALGDLLAIASLLADRLTIAVSAAYNSEIQKTGGGAGQSADARGRERERAGGTDVVSIASEQLDLRRNALVGARRARVMRAIAEVVAEEGWAGASVEMVIERARISRKTLYELFPGGLREGLAAALDDTAEQVNRLTLEKLEAGGSWQDGVRGALAALLVFFDSEPALARLCFVETLAGDREVVEGRARAVRAFQGIVVDRIGRDVGVVSPQVAESAIVSVIGILYNRLIAPEPEPLIDLLGELMGTLMRMSAATDRTVKEEINRSEQVAKAIQQETPTSPPRASETGPRVVHGSPGGVTAQRTRTCLLYLAEHPDASNRDIGEATGVPHKSQTSKLLSQLRKGNLIIVCRDGPGAQNKWRLAPRGRELAEELITQ